MGHNTHLKEDTVIASDLLVLVGDELELEVGAESSVLASGVGPGEVRVLGIAGNGENLSVEGGKLLELGVEGENLGGADLSFVSATATSAKSQLSARGACSGAAGAWSHESPVHWVDYRVQAAVSYSSDRRPGNELPRRHDSSPKPQPLEGRKRTEEDEPLSLKLLELDSLEEAIGDDGGLHQKRALSAQAHSAATRSVELL
jgi:hypothetical protein